MRRLLACVAITLLLANGFGSRARAAEERDATINGFLATCTNDALRGNGQSSCAQIFLAERAFDPDACLGQSPSSELAIVTWLHNHPEMAASSAVDGVHAAAKALYPCAAPAPSAAVEKFRNVSALRSGCFSESAEQAQVGGCTKLIQSGLFAGDALADAFLTRGFAQLALQQYQPAIADFGEAITRKKTVDAQAYFGRGTARTALKQFQQAIPDFDQAIRLKPDDAVSYNNRAYCNLKVGQFRRAITDYDQALALTPKSAPLLYMRGIAKLRLNDERGGDTDIASAVALQSNIAEQFAAVGVKP